MPEYDNTNRGAIWPNKKKETERHPDFTGSANIGGFEYWVSAWKKTPKDKENSPSLRFSFQAKDATKEQSAPHPAPRLDDDIPF